MIVQYPFLIYSVIVVVTLCTAIWWMHIVLRRRIDRLEETLSLEIDNLRIKLDEDIQEFCEKIRLSVREFCDKIRNDITNIEGDQQALIDSLDNLERGISNLENTLSPIPGAKPLQVMCIRPQFPGGHKNQDILVLRMCYN